ncbi:bacteriophage protein [Salmonella bongori]|nr:bacteriophage protein [Salmonella bongori]
MERDELEEDRATFIAGEIGGAVVELIIDGVVISRDATVKRLKEKRR